MRDRPTNRLSVKENLTYEEITKDEDTDLDKSIKRILINRSWGFEKCFSQTAFQSLSLHSSFKL